MPKKSLKRRVRDYLDSQEPPLSQKAFADQLGISESHLSKILSGDDSPSLTVAADIERLTGIPARDFAEVA